LFYIILFLGRSLLILLSGKSRARFELSRMDGMTFDVAKGWPRLGATVHIAAIRRIRVHLAFCFTFCLSWVRTFYLLDINIRCCCIPGLLLLERRTGLGASLHLD